jgi:peptidoglycan-associated lipoprotein
MSKIIKLAVMLCALFFIIGCPPGDKGKVKTEPTNPVPVEPISKDEPSIKNKDFATVPEMKSIYFGYDSYTVSPADGKILQANADYLKTNKNLEVLIEGNCCECGTIEYNLALGQKRAAAVRDYYIKLGIDSGSIATISYGKEKPVNLDAGPPDSPKCVANRQAVTKVREK